MAETRSKPMSDGVAPVDDYQAQDDVRTLTRAHQIRSDPKRHKRAQAHAASIIAATADPDGDTVKGKTPKKGK